MRRDKRLPRQSRNGGDSSSTAPKRCDSAGARKQNPRFSQRPATSPFSRIPVSNPLGARRQVISRGTPTVTSSGRESRKGQLRLIDRALRARRQIVNRFRKWDQNGIHFAELEPRIQFVAEATPVGNRNAETKPQVFRSGPLRRHGLSRNIRFPTQTPKGSAFPQGITCRAAPCVP